MMEDGGKCDKCGSSVTVHDLHIVRVDITTNLQAADQGIEALSIEMANLDTMAQEAHLAKTDMRIKVATEARDDLTAKFAITDEALTASKKAIIAMTATDLEWSAVGTRIQIETLKYKMQIDTNLQMAGALTASLEKDADVKRQVAEARDEAGKVQTALDLILESSRYYEVIVKGMGDKGVKAHKFGAMIQVLNDLVAENIRVLTDGQVQVWFSPWREKANAKNGDDVVPEIQIYVKEGPKEQVELALYSGMERQQIVIAIIRAFNKLAILQGAGTNLLFMDEMFGMFDEASAATAIKLMNQLKDSDWGTIIIVTHNPDIKQLIDYDQLWTATKENHITTLKRERNDNA